MNACSRNISLRARRACGIAALILLSMGLAALPASAAETLTVGKAGQNVFAFALLDVGVKAGLFAKQGLNLEVSQFANGSALHQAMAAGSIDVGLGGGSDFVALAKGAPEKAVGALSGPPYDFGIAVQADGPIRAIADLKGARIGVTTLSSLTAWLTGELARQQGWGRDGINRIAVGANATSVALLRTREIDGFTADLGAVLQVEQVKSGRLLLQFGDIVKNFYTFVIFARTAALKERPAAVRAFLQGWYDSVEFACTNRNTALDVMTDTVGRDRALVARLYDQLVPTYSRDGRFAAGPMQGLARALNDQFGLDQAGLSGLYTEELLPQR
jgi:NitT/TauT family transport system substrate-binding protein